MSESDSMKKDEISSSMPAAEDFASDPRMHFVEATGKWIYTSDDGFTWEYNESQQNWQQDEEVLMKTQQLAYSVPGVNESEPAAPVRVKRKNVYTMDDTDQDIKKQKQKKKPTNTSVYVSGLPPDVTVQELAEVFSKYGVLLEDLNSGGPKIKLYKDDQDRLKGDALVTYLKEESVTLACQLLDETDLRPNEASKIRVQKAQFKEKDPKLPVEGQTKNNSGKSDKRKAQRKLQQLEKKLDWFETETGKKAERYNKIVILKHMFTLEELENDVSLILDLKQEIREECEKLGEVTNVILYDKEPDGVVSVKFKEQLSAEACVLKMNGRFFAGRRIEAEIFDGKQKYQKTGAKSNETEEEELVRLEKYAKWLEQEDAKKF
ncbi:4288_t:CDS:10 [Acaulospora morrowiae]|uniref:4288_t:CDS:1 n=1 Tax=Acaulospora morrowiae TaxID=94023 RepID=A0A9N9B0M2_9GLOM|nr:4288_t:CDS:10 [Acaulospora morrowiae]